MRGFNKILEDWKWSEERNLVWHDKETQIVKTWLRGLDLPSGSQTRHWSASSKVWRVQKSNVGLKIGVLITRGVDQSPQTLEHGMLCVYSLPHRQEIGFISGEFAFTPSHPRPPPPQTALPVNVYNTLLLNINYPRPTGKVRNAPTWKS